MFGHRRYRLKRMRPGPGLEWRLCIGLGRPLALRSVEDGGRLDLDQQFGRG